MGLLFGGGLFALAIALVVTLGKPGQWLEQRLWQRERIRRRQDEP